MKIVEVLGPGCANCQRLEANAREAVAMAGVEAEVRHITDYRGTYAEQTTPKVDTEALFILERIMLLTKETLPEKQLRLSLEFHLQALLSKP